jgi:hypothetical protein
MVLLLIGCVMLVLRKKSLEYEDHRWKKMTGRFGSDGASIVTGETFTARNSVKPESNSLVMNYPVPVAMTPRKSKKGSILETRGRTKSVDYRNLSVSGKKSGEDGRSDGRPVLSDLSGN